MKPIAIAFYLPQYHPIPENSAWWGEGFTEWSNVKKAVPLFPGHRQPVRPGELGYYDLRDPETRVRQAELAGDHGITGFCYWHYWFGNGRKLLEMPLREMLRTGEPDFPFCLGWANESWTGIWHGAPDRVLMEQRYPGKKDIENHFYDILPALSDERYITIDGRPFFLVYKPESLPDISLFTDTFNELALKNGLNRFHFVATNVPVGWNTEEYGFDAVVPAYHNRIVWGGRKRRFGGIRSLFMNRRKRVGEETVRHVYSYKEAMNYFLPSKKQMKHHVLYPMVVPNWDNSPRAGKRGVVFTDSTPDLFRKHVSSAIDLLKYNNKKHKILMIKSWNEWAEGNYLEPDKTWGRAYLEMFERAIKGDKPGNV